jgi:hypothetical protein
MLLGIWSSIVYLVYETGSFKLLLASFDVTYKLFTLLSYLCFSTISEIIVFDFSKA